MACHRAANALRLIGVVNRTEDAKNEMTIEPDQLIDNRYKIIKHLGQGGMGTVWKATDQQAGGDVVIKMPLDDSNPVILQRFGNEAKMMRQHSMGNQSILDIQGMGDIDGVPYYVMRFLSGGSLEDRCPIVDEQGQPDFRPESYEWLTTIAKALDFLHSKDVLHRDVKPGNILFNESGDAYLVDFGIVKSPLEASNFTSAPTAANTSPGTIEYMPPEVLAGEVDAISGLGDQYALAVTLYQMIAGKRPFTGPTETAIYRAIEKGAPSLVEIKAGMPPTAAKVVSKALNSDPLKRFETCRKFATAFDSALRFKLAPKSESVVVDLPCEAPTGMVAVGGVNSQIRGGAAVQKLPDASGNGGLDCGESLFGKRAVTATAGDLAGTAKKPLFSELGLWLTRVLICGSWTFGVIGLLGTFHDRVLLYSDFQIISEYALFIGLSIVLVTFGLGLRLMLRTVSLPARDLFSSYLTTLLLSSLFWLVLQYPYLASNSNHPLVVDVLPWIVSLGTCFALWRKHDRIFKCLLGSVAGFLAYAIFFRFTFLDDSITFSGSVYVLVPLVLGASIGLPILTMRFENGGHLKSKALTTDKAKKMELVEFPKKS